MKKKNIILGLLLGLGLAFFVPEKVNAFSINPNAIGKNGSCTIETEQAGFTNPNCLDRKSPITFKVTNAVWKEEKYTGAILIKIAGVGIRKNLDSNGGLNYTWNTPGQIKIGESKKVEITNAEVIIISNLMCSTNFGLISEECTDEERVLPENMPYEICNQIPDSVPKGKCETCLNQNGVWTAIGCIDTSSTEGIVGKLMTVGISIAGGIALLMILASAFMFATSEGEPKRTSEAKEILSSAVIGLIFIIFSVTILQFIGVNILKIPGFGE